MIMVIIGLIVQLYYKQTEVCSNTLQGLEPCAEFQQRQPPV